MVDLRIIIDLSIIIFSIFTIYMVLWRYDRRKIKKSLKRVLDYEEINYIKEEPCGKVEDFIEPEKVEIPYIDKYFTIENHSIVSEYAKERLHYILIYPNDAKEREYPCTTFLHGIHDSKEDWIEKAKLLETYNELLEAGKVKKMIILIPESGYNGTSWYTDFYKEPDKRYESFFNKELYPRLHREFNISSMGIAGFSMGGNGAFRIGLRNIDKFRVIGSTAGALCIRRMSFNKRLIRFVSLLYIPEFIFRNPDKRHFIRVFGSRGKNILLHDPHLMLQRYKKYIQKDFSDHYFYLSVGDEDIEKYLMILQWIDMVKRMKHYKLNFKGNLYQKGFHNWDYVSRDLPNLLQYFSDKLI